MALGHALAGTSIAERFAAAKRFELRVADVTVTAVATRIVTAALVGFVAAVAATALPVVAGASIPVWMLLAAPFVDRLRHRLVPVRHDRRVAGQPVRATSGPGSPPTSRWCRCA